MAGVTLFEKIGRLFSLLRDQVCLKEGGVKCKCQPCLAARSAEDAAMVILKELPEKITNADVMHTTLSKGSLFDEDYLEDKDPDWLALSRGPDWQGWAGENLAFLKKENEKKMVGKEQNPGCLKCVHCVETQYSTMSRRNDKTDFVCCPKKKRGYNNLTGPCWVEYNFERNKDGTCEWFEQKPPEAPWHIRLGGYLRGNKKPLTKGVDDE